MTHGGRVPSGTHDLHYSQARLTKAIAVTGGLFVLGLWVFTDRSTYDPATASSWVRMLGPVPVEVMAGIAGLTCVVYLFGCLRILWLSEFLAVRADRDGLTINGMLRRRRFAWSDLRSIELSIASARRRPIYVLRVRPCRGRQVAVPVSVLSEAPVEVEAWVDRVRGYLAPDRDAPTKSRITE